jgi:transposase-like protein
VRRFVEPDSTVYTDQATSYQGLDRYFAHKSVNHTREYVSGDVHTNTIENFWSLLKRAIKGTQIHVSGDHMNRYVIERAFAYNYRECSDLERMQKALGSVGGRRITYQMLKAR